MPRMAPLIFDEEEEPTESLECMPTHSVRPTTNVSVGLNFAMAADLMEEIDATNTKPKDSPQVLVN
jgi:hypothetical protein